MNIQKRTVVLDLTELDALILDRALRDRIENGPMPGAATQNCLEAVHNALDDQCSDVLRNREDIAKQLKETWNRHRSKLLDLACTKKVNGFGAALTTLLNEWNKNCGAEAKLTTDWPAVTEAIAHGRWDEVVLCYGCAGYLELFMPDELGELLSWCHRISDTPA